MSAFKVRFLATAVIGTLAFAPGALAQAGGWRKDQVNTTMCYWAQPRAHQMRDTVYVDGGELGWSPTLATGEIGQPIADENPAGLIYTLNFTRAFNTSQNTSTLFGSIAKAPGGGVAANIAPNYIDGALLGNDYGFYLYGGLLTQTDLYSPPDADNVYAYRGYRDPDSTVNFSPSFLNDKLPSGLTRYVAYGGAASAPSENKAWYFSGQRSPTWGPIYMPSNNNSINAVNVSSTLITLDMSQTSVKWTNKTLPDNSVKGRAGPELVWVPYGKQGLLVAIGGVTFPEFQSPNRTSPNPAASKSEGQGFAQDIDVYDIAGDKWYRQTTYHTGPGPVTRGCAVVAYAQDMSSVNIFYYGGYNGVDSKSDFYDDVWVLTLPSFMWVKVKPGKQHHGRAGHKCFMPYPDLMVVIGGQRGQPGEQQLCLEGGLIQLFNLTSLEWQDSYDPAKYSKYLVSDILTGMIGGNGTGGATAKAPEPTGFQDTGLASVFATAYPTSKITTYYPYASAASSDNTNPSLPSGGGGGGGGGSGVPSYVGPVVGVIGGLVLITSIIAGWLIYRRRHLLRRNQGGASEAGTADDNGNRIMRWMHGQPSEHKAPPTVTATEETVFTPDMENGTPIPPKSVQSVPSSVAPTAYQYPAAAPAEMADTHVVELMDTSPRIELQDTGLTPLEIINKHSHFAQQQNNGGSIHSSNLYSSIAQTDHASMVSRSSGGQRAASAPPHGSGDGSVPGRPDSPALGDPGHDTVSELPLSHQQQQQQQQPFSPVSRLESGVSGISDRDKRHLRHISDETVSSFTTGVAGPAGGGGATAAQAGGIVSPTSAVLQNNGGAQQHPLVGTPPVVSPPETGEAEDYLTSRGQQPQQQRGSSGGLGSSLRKSVFRESSEDLGGGQR